MFFQVCQYFILIKTLFVFQFFSTHFFIKHSNNLLYFSTCLSRALECLGLLIVVFRMFKKSFEAPYNRYTSRNSQKSSQDSRWNNWFPDGSGRPEGGKLASSLVFFSPFQLSFLHLFKGGAFSTSEHEFAAQNSAILFSKVSKHTCNPLEPKQLLYPQLSDCKNKE